MPRFLVLSLTALLLALWTAPAALAQSKSGGPRIEWEVKNRFRLFRSEADFQRHVAADRGDGLLAAEDRLARESDGRGWARDTVERLCVDRAGKLLETCDRDGTLEDYLAPRDHQHRRRARRHHPGECRLRLERATTAPGRRAKPWRAARKR